jgi:hypothetical protein
MFHHSSDPHRPARMPAATRWRAAARGAGEPQSAGSEKPDRRAAIWRPFNLAGGTRLLLNHTP